MLAGCSAWAAPTLILLVAFGLRLFRLGDANLWWDEALAVWGVRKGLLGVTLWTAGDVHPPLYFWSLWAWVQAVGESEFAMRVLSVAYGVLTVAVVYRFGCMLAGRGVGSLGALLISLSRFHVWWSQEMRMYVLAGLLGMLSLYLFIRWLRSVQSPVLGKSPRTLYPGLHRCALYHLSDGSGYPGGEHRGAHGPRVAARRWAQAAAPPLGGGTTGDPGRPGRMDGVGLGSDE